jgi:hypothetical protein
MSVRLSEMNWQCCRMLLGTHRARAATLIARCSTHNRTSTLAFKQVKHVATPYTVAVSKGGWLPVCAPSYIATHG